ncbi:MAG: thiopurine S-methyltransferase [Cyanobacteria bacterium P01_F01_bin.86]
METSFWQQKWERGDIGFHKTQANPLLVKHVNQLMLPQGSRIFLPLCGMTLDISWLLAQGFRVAGVELSPFAINELFEALKLEPQITTDSDFLHYSAKDIDIFVGNIFDLSAAYLGPVNAIYDRAALVALPEETRPKYASHLIHLTHAASQLLISYEYNQSLMAGPPFAIKKSEIERLYGATYQLQPIERQNIAGGLKGKVVSAESVWLLQQGR